MKPALWVSLLLASLNMPIYTGNGAYTMGDPLAAIPFYLPVTMPAALIAVVSIGGIKPQTDVRVTGVSFRVNVAGGGGAGSTVFRVSDGTNNCDTTIPCTVSATIGTYYIASGGGAACNFTSNVALSIAVTASSCTVVQPTLLGPVSVEYQYR